MLSVAGQEIHCGNVVDKMDTPPRAETSCITLTLKWWCVGGGGWRDVFRAPPPPQHPLRADARTRSSRSAESISRIQ